MNKSLGDYSSLYSLKFVLLIEVQVAVQLKFFSDN